MLRPKTERASVKFPPLTRENPDPPNRHTQ